MIIISIPMIFLITIKTNLIKIKKLMTLIKVIKNIPNKHKIKIKKKKILPKILKNVLIINSINQNKTHKKIVLNEENQ
jgi:hypothetical protein